RCTDRAGTVAYGVLEALLRRDRLDEVDVHLGVVTGHDHLGAFRQRHDAGDIGGAEVELRTVVVEERRVAAALLLGQDDNLALELTVRGGRTRLDDDLTTLDVLALGTTQDQTDVVTGLTLVEELAEHLHTGDGGGLLLFLDANDVNGLVDVDDTALDTAGDDGAATGDRED